MLSSTALGAPRFSITRDRRSSATRRSSLPKLARARSAETTMLSFLSVLMGQLFISIIRTAQLIRNYVKRGRTSLLSGNLGHVGRRKRLPHLPLSHGPREPARAFHIKIEHRRDVESQQLRDYQAAYHGKAQRAARLGAGAETERDRQRAHQRRHGGHHDGPEAHQTC